jgi:hypothetical protein
MLQWHEFIQTQNINKVDAGTGSIFTTYKTFNLMKASKLSLLMPKLVKPKKI